MQVTVKDIKVKTGISKSGKNEGKPWKLIIIIGEDGTEFTTFDAGAEEVGIGGVIELEPIIKAGKINFTEFKIIRKGAQAPLPNGERSGMTPEMWAEKDARDRWSKECNTCFMGVMQLATVWPTDKKAQETIGIALDWAKEHLEKPSEAARAFNVPKPDATKSTVGASGDDLKGLVFADAGKLKTACKDRLKMTLPQIESETGGFDLKTERGWHEAWMQIVSIYGENGEKSK